MGAKPQVLRPAEPTVIPVARAAQDPIRAACRVMQTVVAQARAPPRRMVGRQRPRQRDNRNYHEESRADHDLGTG